MHIMDIKDMLEEGNLNSDGLANDVAKIVLNNNLYFEELLNCLQNSDDRVRAHASDAVEKILRVNKILIDQKIEFLLKLAKTESLSIVKMHYAMTFAYIFEKDAFLDDILNISYSYLQDQNAFVITWAISTLTIIAIKREDKKKDITENLQKLLNHPSKAVQNRLQKALNVLLKKGKIPRSWIKNEIENNI